MQSIHLSRDQRHLAWDNNLDPVAVVGPGDELTLDLADASGGQIDRHDDASAIARLDINTVNPCTGPVFIEGVAPGDDLVVEILEIATENWAWTANIPGFGLLSDDFPEPRLWISTVRDGVITTAIGVEIGAHPMIGTIGVAPATFGPTPLLVPTMAGGNMDISQLVAGSTLHLPAQVPGGLLSAGDTHAVQGDGEVCGTGTETPATVRLRVDVVSPASFPAPWYEHSVQRKESEWTCTTGIGPDLFQAARDATRRAVDLVATRAGLDPVDAYLLLSLTGELRVSEIVDAPNWVMSMHVPTRYTRS
jgi:acetamidase/formamidase